ncbi:uncharacterized protein LOC128185221 [Crassostrea angulata]|uniref:uncharacterized protein LOC128185221 n=1 Tax=Magallana angulata TaxID=2784310 RepID=UPI0022B163FC|nr:uncharacterized protein LOC128185221 [Crassostrea angulata]
MQKTTLEQDRSIVMMDIRECFVKTDVPIQHLEVNAVKDAIAASSFVIIQMDVVLQLISVPLVLWENTVKKCVIFQVTDMVVNKIAFVLSQTVIFKKDVNAKKILQKI